MTPEWTPRRPRKARGRCISCRRRSLRLSFSRRKKVARPADVARPTDAAMRGQWSALLRNSWSVASHLIHRAVAARAFGWSPFSWEEKEVPGEMRSLRDCRRTTSPFTLNRHTRPVFPHVNAEEAADREDRPIPAAGIPSIQPHRAARSKSKFERMNQQPRVQTPSDLRSFSFAHYN